MTVRVNFVLNIGLSLTVTDVSTTCAVVIFKVKDSCITSVDVIKLCLLTWLVQSRCYYGRLSVEPWCYWLRRLVMSLVRFDPSIVSIVKLSVVQSLFFIFTGLELICLMTAAGSQIARDHSNVCRNHVRQVRKFSFFLTKIGQDLHDTVQHMLQIASLPLLKIFPKHKFANSTAILGYEKIFLLTDTVYTLISKWYPSFDIFV